MMPIAISLVTANQLPCCLAAADDYARPECASTAHNDYSFVRNSQPIRLIAAISCPFGPPRHRACGFRRPPHRRLQPNPHSAR
jgi:hypothetical protein